MSTNPVYHNLSWDTSFQNSQQRHYRQCDFNCLCCARMQLGFYCACNTSKESRSSQTIEYDTLPQTMDEARLWKKGTTEHTSLQSLITKVIQKYNLKDSKDPHLPSAIKEIMLLLGKSFQSPQTTDNEKKVKNRLLKSLEWRRYYSRKRASAVSTGKSIRDLVKRRRNEDITDKENLLEEDLHDVGCDNRAFEGDSSDSDVPLAELVKKNK